MEATNPDPFDEPWGIKEWTRAYDGEDPLDRVIRFSPQSKKWRESYVQTPVTVFAVDPPECAETAIDANVELISVKDGKGIDHPPRFEGRDGLVAEASFEPVIPLALRIRSAKMDISRVFVSSVNEYLVAITKGSSGLVIERFMQLNADGWPKELGGKALELRKTWIASIPTRLCWLKSKRDGENDPAKQSILDSRIRTCSQLIDIKSPLSYANDQRYLKISSESALHKPSVSTWPCTTVGTGPWPLALYFLGFDADALAGICVGSIKIPLEGG